MKEGRWVKNRLGVQDSFFLCIWEKEWAETKVELHLNKHNEFKQNINKFIIFHGRIATP